jgi:hypothetical protein
MYDPKLTTLEYWNLRHPYRFVIGAFCRRRVIDAGRPDPKQTGSSASENATLLQAMERANQFGPFMSLDDSMEFNKKRSFIRAGRRLES